jgi:predicted HD phosphohydrolase
VEDEELVVVALLHDIGETLSPINHGEVAAGTHARSLMLSVPVCECMTRPRTLTPNP